MFKDSPQGTTHSWCENHNKLGRLDCCCCHPIKMCSTQNNEDWENRLSKIFDTEQLKTEDIFNFVRSVLAKQKQEILSEIEKKYLGDNCTDKHDGKICGRPIHVRYQAGYNRALVDVTEIVYGPTNKRKEGCEIQIS